jgi:hypothetical protein
MVFERLAFEFLDACGRGFLIRRPFLIPKNDWNTAFYHDEHEGHEEIHK